MHLRIALFRVIRRFMLSHDGPTFNIACVCVYLRAPCRYFWCFATTYHNVATALVENVRMK